MVHQRKLRAFFRREAARTSVPDDMWQRISSQLEQDRRKPGHLNLRRLIVPAIGLCAVASVFWFTLMPATAHDQPDLNQTASALMHSTRVSHDPGPSEGQKAAGVRYELGPEIAVAIAQSAPSDHHAQRYGELTR